MSVRTAWEIAALEDVRLAPSPRQQRPAPGPVCAAAASSPFPGAPSQGPGAADREGHTPQLGPVSLSSRLFGSYSACRPHLRDTGGQELGSLGPSLFPAPALDTKVRPLPRSRDVLSQGQPSASGSEETLGKSAEPFLPRAWRRGARAGVATEPARRARGGGVAQTTLHPVLGLDHAQGMGSKTKPAVQSGQRHAAGRGQPPRVTDLRKEGRGAEALLPLPVSQAGPGPSDVLWSSFVPPQPSEPPSPT